MSAKLRLLIEPNVILDMLQTREPCHAMSARVLACGATGQVEGWVAAHSLTTLFYLLARYQSASYARVTLTELFSFLSVAAVDHAVSEQALNLPYQDFEDAVEMMAAVRARVQYLITRNVRGYKDGPLPVLQRAELL